MTVKPFFALLAAGALTLAVTPAGASPALIGGLTAPSASTIQFGEGCTGGKCGGEKGEKGEKGEEAPAQHVELSTTPGSAR